MSFSDGIFQDMYLNVKQNIMQETRHEQQTNIHTIQQTRQGMKEQMCFSDTPEYRL